MKVIKEHGLFLLLLLLAALLRFIPLFEYQFTYDELSGLERTQFNSFGDLMEKGVKVDAHPAFVQLLIFCVVKLFGYHTWIIKLPFLLFSLGTIIYGYTLGLKFFSKHVGLFITIFLSFSLVFVFYAPIARMYISGVFFSLGLLYYFLGLMSTTTNGLKCYILFGLFALLSGFNHHINALFAMSVYVCGFIFIPKTKRGNYIFTGLAVVLAYLPHLGLTLYQLGVGGIGINQGGWLDKPAQGAVLGFIKILFGTGRSYVLVLVFVLITALINKRFVPTKIQMFLLLVFIVNYLIIYFYSVYRAPVYQHSMMLFSGVALLTLVGSLTGVNHKLLSNGFLLICSLLLVYKTYIKKEYFSQAVKTIFEHQFERTLYYKKKYGAANVYPVFFDADEIMKKIYFNKYQTTFDCKVSADTLVKSVHLFSEWIASLNCDYITLGSSLPAQQALVKQYYPYLLENTQTQGINFKLYSRRPTDKTFVVPDDNVLLLSNPLQPGVLNYSGKSITDLGYRIKSDVEFPFDARALYHSVVYEEGNVVLLSVKLDCREGYCGNMEACTHINEQGLDKLYGYAAKAAHNFVLQADSTVNIYSDYFAGTTHTKASEATLITCYIWNRAKETATLRQFEIKVIDYWHPKWHFWD